MDDDIATVPSSNHWSCVMCQSSICNDHPQSVKSYNQMQNNTCNYYSLNVMIEYAQVIRVSWATYLII